MMNRGKCATCVYAAEIAAKLRARPDQLYCTFFPPASYLHGMRSRPLMGKKSLLDPTPMMMSEFETRTMWEFARTLEGWCCGQYQSGEKAKELKI